MSDTWVTEVELEQILKEYRYLNGVDPTSGNWRDLAWTFFDPKVLEKYGKISIAKLVLIILFS